MNKYKTELKMLDQNKFKWMKWLYIQLLGIQYCNTIYNIKKLSLWVTSSQKSFWSFIVKNKYKN